ncbi:mandelate racemase/muconate lactonizing enzyme family protein [Verminephrobacter aporrectodeae subsp. tuberculatae]|uniref:Mandelate racemase/muconate lactonizing enzyme family protein n=1 Tax=Verminephrobacter aporrectodeae subsp. tuberculatae TaxID=1110392 RepID=A0ABT3KW63_9BURK|nr:mandelate racemase/muconate lactonizing enzyme family protein [Verminephrobacter aporrectodeae]MCW5256689.1 mandelate racemase/muconate lactonizing enzyme family protein [Verminephrobacter aporrectodeae subsp. tuberculatae]MCW5322144.1 mandelate racemase/muconate lactonizing enzyme family protein [Verminephrobacter aporrectodeae subsp. tuberculatae]MCW8197374.1 mandelate racemase/muconate lactonizing enzyme family protein [Verminephrobacter aporrectodeae subsp. tuberculatae]
MKVVSMKSYAVAVPPPYFGGMYWIFVRLKTDCGIEGVGEVYASTFHPKVILPAIDDVFERYLLNHDPHHIERFFRAAYSSGFTQRPDLTMMGIASGLEMACWDIIGKAAGKPVYELIGGRVHERLRSYTYLYPKNSKGEYDYDDVDLAVECAMDLMKQGFTAVKFDPAGPYSVYSGHHLSLEVIDKSEEFCKKIRSAVGNKCDLLFGTHGQMTPASAVRLAHRLEKYDPLWFEEPVPPGQADAMAIVAGKTSIPVAAGERLSTKYEFFDLLNRGAASILQMNLGRVGGILEAKKIAGMAEAFYAQIAPHLYNGPVGAAASIQLATATPNFLIQESILTWQGFHAELLKKPIQWEDGFIIPSREPGLGIELNMDVVEAHSPYTGTKLHISMDPEPFDVKRPSNDNWKKRWRNEKAQ